MRVAIVHALLLSAALPVTALAQQQPAPAPAVGAFGLGEIVVTAQAPSPLTVGTSTLNADTIYTFDRTTLDDALNLVAGAASGSTGGTRNERLIFVRGFNRFEVPLLIDGIQVYLPADNRLDFGRFLTNDIAEIQVAKGYASVLNGPDGMGGAINLVTSKPTRALEADMTGTLDLGRNVEYGGYNLSGRIGTRHDTWYAQVSAGRNYTDHWDLAGGFVPTATQAAGQRQFSQSEDWRVNVKAGFTPNATDEYSINYTRQEGSKLAPLSVADTLASQKFWTWPAWNMDSVYFLSTTQIDPIATLKTRIYRNTFYNLLRSFDSIAETTQTRPYAFNSPYWDSAYGGSAELALRPSSVERLSVSAHYRLDQHQEQQTSFPGAFTEPRLTDRESTVSLAAENELHLTSRLTLLAGVGYDLRHLMEAEAYGAPLGKPSSTPSVLYGWPLSDVGAWSGQGQITWQPDDETSLHASISSRARFPTLFERFSQKFDSAIPNPYLRPERATNYEIGGSHRLGVVKVEGAAFYSHLNDVIVSQPELAYGCTASTTPGPCAPTVLTQSVNAGNGNYYGAEISLEAHLAPSLSVGGNYTYIHQHIAAPTSTVNDLAAAPTGDPTGVPNDKAFVYADWAPVKRLHILPSADIESSRWTVTDVAPIVYFRTGSHVNAALRAEYMFARGIQAAIGVRNLFDQNYQLVSGYPEPGRSFYASVKVSY